jgi:hypothetical protein
MDIFISISQAERKEKKRTKKQTTLRNGVGFP